MPKKSLVILFFILLLIFSCQPQKDNIYHAIDVGQKNVIIKILDSYPELIETKDKKESPLYYAFKNNADEEIIRLLLQRTESNDVIQFISLVYALTNEWFEICDIFIEEGFDINKEYDRNISSGSYVYNYPKNYLELMKNYGVHK